MLVGFGQREDERAASASVSTFAPSRMMIRQSSISLPALLATVHADVDDLHPKT
jgi:hypothetical protein